jgi:hypothetical protein
MLDHEKSQNQLSKAVYYDESAGLPIGNQQFWLAYVPATS